MQEERRRCILHLGQPRAVLEQSLTVDRIQRHLHAAYSAAQLSVSRWPAMPEPAAPFHAVSARLYKGSGRVALDEAAQAGAFCISVWVSSSQMIRPCSSFCCRRYTYEAPERASLCTSSSKRHVAAARRNDRALYGIGRCHLMLLGVMLGCFGGHDQVEMLVDMHCAHLHRASG
jgi:hypothetical protein